MLREAWQRAMIALARSERAKAFMQGRHTAGGLADRFVAGTSLQESVECACGLLREAGIHSSLFFLGEYVDSLKLVHENVANKKAVARALGHAGLDVHVSIDPTQVGQHIDAQLAHRNLRVIAETIDAAALAREGFHCAMLDMEDESVTDATIALHDGLRAAGLPAALTLQAYLRRTEADLAAQIASASRVRLVNGAMAASAAATFPSRGDVKANYRHLIEAMFSRQARDGGFYPIVATHDTWLHEHALECAARGGWAAGSFEFEMLFGVRTDVAQALAKNGHKVRLYLPFGRDWWPYAVRRIGENPRNALLLARSAIAGGEPSPRRARGGRR
jgi:proline dehydrogenase